MNVFPERLKELRLNNNLSQTTLAKALNVSQAAIARWEAGLQTPNIEFAVAIAKYFNVSTDYLLGLKNNNDED